MVGQIGHLSGLKQPLFTIEVIEEALKKNSKIKLLFVGDGPLFEKAKNWCLENNIHSTDNFHPYKNLFALKMVKSKCWKKHKYLSI